MVWILAAAVVAVAAVGAAVWLLSSPGDDTEPRSAAVRSDDSLSEADATKIAQNQLEAHLEACTEPAAVAPDSCGIAIPWAADFGSVTGIRYRIEQMPVLTLTPPTFRADDGILVATVTGTGLDGAAKSLTYRTTDWMLRGDAEVKPNDVVLTPW